MQLLGKSGKTYELQMPCVPRRKDGLPSSTWLAFDANNRASKFIIKQPWDMMPHKVTLLRREQAFHEKLKDICIFRRLEDTVPEVTLKEDNSLIEPPRLVLELMEKTVWHARWERRFTRREIKMIIKLTLFNLREIERLGMVNTGMCKFKTVDLLKLNMCLRLVDGEHDARQSPCGANRPSRGRPPQSYCQTGWHLEVYV